MIWLKVKNNKEKKAVNVYIYGNDISLRKEPLSFKFNNWLISCYSTKMFAQVKCQEEG